jgi:Protein kinase domain.
MCDPYQKWEVNEKVDIWMLGCILFTLCFYKHPFQDEMSKLSIVNAAYTFPKEHKYNEKMLDFIRLMLTPNPKFRPSIHEVCDILENYYKIDKIPLNVGFL